MILLVGVISSAKADGLINFFTFNANPAYGRAYASLCLCIPAYGPDWVGQLSGGTSAGSLSPIGTPTAFLTGAGAGYINYGNVTVTGVEAGIPYFYALRYWPIFQPSFSLQTGIVQIILGGTTSAGGFFATPQANGFPSNGVPEPATFALAGLGLGALFVAHRRKRD